MKITILASSLNFFHYYNNILLLLMLTRKITMENNKYNKKKKITPLVRDRYYFSSSCLCNVPNFYY